MGYGSFKERLEKAMADNGFENTNQLAAAMGYKSQQKVWRLIADEKNSPSLPLLDDLEKVLVKTDFKWLCTGRSTSNLNDNLKSTGIKHIGLMEPKTAYKSLIGGIPLLDVEAAAGRGNEVFNLNNYDIEANYFIPDFEKVDFMLKVRGNSMWPKYNGGDVVACRIIKSLTSIQWNRAYVIAAGDNGILIKRLKRSTIEGNYLLVSDNKDYDPIEMPISEVQGLALVVGTIRLE